MKLSIIIVSWNVKDLLKTCLASIFINVSGFDFEVIVVDNASSDGTPEMIGLEYPRVKFIQNKENLGFGKANNVGLRQATGEYLLFLNDDTEINDNIFSKLFSKFEVDQKLGMIGCKLLNQDNSIQPSVRNFPKLKDQAVILTKLHNLNPKLICNYTQENFDYNKEQEADQVMGAFMLTKKSILDEVGDFDEKFFLWFEEVDLQKRLQKAGYKIIYYPEVSIKHIKEASFKQLNRFSAQINYNKSLLHYFWKNGSKSDWLILLLLQPLSLFLALIVQIFKLK